MIKGYSIIAHQGAGHYTGPYQTGVFSDNCEWNRKPAPERKGWGFKLDMFMCRILRPVPAIDRPEPDQLIRDMLAQGEGKAMRLFGAKIYELLMFKVPHGHDPATVRDFKYSIYNPWYGLYWFLLDSKRRLPCIFLSVSTPWKSFYIGMKTYQVDPLTKDSTWATGIVPYRAACPSATIRSDRG